MESLWLEGGNFDVSPQLVALVSRLCNEIGKHLLWLTRLNKLTLALISTLSLGVETEKRAVVSKGDISHSFRCFSFVLWIPLELFTLKMYVLRNIFGG